MLDAIDTPPQVRQSAFDAGVIEGLLAAEVGHGRRAQVGHDLALAGAHHAVAAVAREMTADGQVTTGRAVHADRTWRFLRRHDQRTVAAHQHDGAWIPAVGHSLECPRWYPVV
ncbi:MAG: hypothetical protein ACRDT0_07750 [Pseudonocardiaceae bacterium]